ncbi:MAG: DNA gyrase inhibitor YacG [Rhodospirillales bacterium]|nr:DNA gyrase inhibitor YacG [Rhodospirillales bacterium]MDE1882450.1 DNA gyrase inhibitor YacG [Rhodospirillales bacterium]MDE2457669.1 DNA gyrase inhibitor YacG [Rhodospirillales bacterium]
MKCPLCGKPADPEHKPFCSRRCADIDLGRWLNDSYKLPAPLEDDNDEGEAE